MKPVDHFDLANKRAVVMAADKPAGVALCSAFSEAGAQVVKVNSKVANECAQATRAAIAELGGIDILACANDRFFAKPFCEVTPGDLGETMMANFATQFFATQVAVEQMLNQGTGGNIILLTTVLGERGLPNTSVYSAAQGAVFNFVRALAQEVAAKGISVNAIELGWMDWMSDRIDPHDEHAQRALRFTISKRAGRADDVGPLAVWLAGSGVGFVTGQIFPLDGGLTQHL